MCFNIEPQSLEVVCKLITDGSHFSPTPQAEGYPIVNAKDIPNGYINLDSCTKISRADWETLKKQNCAPVPGDVLLSKDGTIGRVVHYESDLGVVTLSSIAILRPRDFIDSCYLAHILRSEAFRRQLLVLESGSALRRIILRDIKTLKFCFPENRAEQTKIAIILSVVDRAIEQTEAMIAKQHRIKAGLMQDLLTLGIDEHGNLRSEQTHKFKDSPLGRIPVEWEVKRLDALTMRIVDGVHHTPTYVESGVPFIVITDLTGSLEIDFSNTRFVTTKDHRDYSKRADPKPRDVLVTKDGTLGVARIVPYGAPEFSIFVSVAMIRPKKEVCLSELIWAFFESGEFLAQLGALSAGTGLKHIHLEHFRSFILRCPPINEQEEIFRTICEQQDLLKETIQSLEKLRRLKSALMQDLLTGTKRVTPLLEP